jgi:hypothetical protein
MKKTGILTVLVLLTLNLEATDIKMKFNFFTDSIESNFWKYFQSIVDEPEELVKSPDRLKLLNDKLDELFPGLGIGILINFNNNERTNILYITSYGDKTKSSTIENLVKKSPQSKKFKVVPFAPASLLQDTISINGKTVNTGLIKFNYAKNNNELNLIFYLPEKPNKAETEFDYSLQTLLMEFLGEFYFYNIGFIDIKTLDEIDGETKKLSELYETFKHEFN